MSWQSYTAQTVLNNARALIDEYNADGVVKSPSTGYIAALELNGIQYINMAIREIFKEVQDVKTFDIDCSVNEGSDDIYTIYTMPDDFGGLDEMINLSCSEVLDYRWVGFNKLYMRNTYLGTVTIAYNAYPTPVETQTDAITVPNPIALEYINNFVAARSAMKFNPMVANFYEQKANELFVKILPNQPAEEESIEDVSRGGYYGYNSRY